MKTFKKWIGFMVAIAVVILSGGTYAMAAEPALTDRVESLQGGGTGVTGADTPPGGQWHEESRRVAEEQHRDFDYYQAEINKAICEMKLESCPVDQILRSSARTRKADSMIIKYYRIGQRPIKTTLKETVTATSGGTGTVIKATNNKIFDNMDVIMLPKVKGYLADGTTQDPNHPLELRVVGRDATGCPIVIAINGKKTSDNNFDLPELPAGTVMLRLGRAAGERDVTTGSYYTMPEPSEQYCQRFIMQVEQSKIEQMLKTVVDWDFLKQERVAVDDMRGGIERSGLFGVKKRFTWGDSGEIYTTEGIYWVAGKDLEIGHWQPKIEIDENGNKVAMTNGDGKTIYEYVIDQKELTSFVNAVIQDAGNGSRTKIFFVDNLIYQALANIKAENRSIFQSEANYMKWNLDFESFSTMGTKILIYRHDAFNYMGMDGMGLCLDPRYLEKWVFGDWSRQEYDLRNLFVRNSDAVVMTEYSGWTLEFPNAHARVSRPEFDSSLGVTDEIEVAA